MLERNNVKNISNIKINYILLFTILASTSFAEPVTKFCTPKAVIINDAINELSDIEKIGAKSEEFIIEEKESIIGYDDKIYHAFIATAKDNNDNTYDLYHIGKKQTYKKYSIRLYRDYPDNLYEYMENGVVIIYSCKKKSR